MSFAGQVKNELIDIPVKSACCRRALVCGLLFRAEIREGNDAEPVITTFLTEDSAAELCRVLIKQQFGRDAEIKKLTRAGKPSNKITFKSKSAAAILNLLSGYEATDVGNAIGFKCECCGRHFLRGVFCSSGSLSDPSKFCHLEFGVPDMERGLRLSALLEELGFEPGFITRKNGCGLYYKNTQAVDDLMTFIGAQEALFSLMNTQIYREIRNNENRATNCVTNNIGKTVSAAQRQLAAIEKLHETGAYDALPEELKITADLREQNGEMSLGDLVMMYPGVITKSGLNHRLIKLIEAAEAGATAEETDK